MVVFSMDLFDLRLLTEALATFAWVIRVLARVFSGVTLVVRFDDCGLPPVGVAIAATLSVST